MLSVRRLPSLQLFDADGCELVGMWFVLNHLPPSRKPAHERIEAAPPPVGVFNGHPVWRRCDVEPLTLFNEEGTIDDQ